MDKYKCRLCFRHFSNGRALGGHMRSHVMNLSLPAKPEESPSAPTQISDGVASASFSLSSEDDEEEEGEGEGEGDMCLSHGLTENPKRNIRIVDPEFAFAVDAGSVVLQDRESETESSKNPTRTRSRRIVSNSVTLEDDREYIHRIQQHNIMLKRRNLINRISKTELCAEPEPASSVSDATTEEDVAFCLMMLSRDKWKRKRDQAEEENDVEEEEDDKEDEENDDDDEAERSFEFSEKSEEVKPAKSRVRGKYKCETCNKVFRSYQALGGHRASHRKMRVCTRLNKPEMEKDNASASMGKKKIHECPVCFRIFTSGQALGGHKRTHVIGASATTVSIRSSTKFEDNMIDLNLPAPIEDDEISQIELSAVSDAGFVNPIRQ